MYRDNGGSLNQNTWIKFCFSRFASMLHWLTSGSCQLLASNALLIFFLKQMGKFYELFEMDAHVGAKELDLQYMKVRQEDIYVKVTFQ